MRVVSLLPSLTELVCALGRGDALVGVTHECDYPIGVERLPHLTRSRIVPDAASAEIDRLVAEQGGQLYDLDAEQLAGEGIEVEVVDLRTLKPLDKTKIIQSVMKTERALIVHEAPVTGGFGGELAAIIAGSEAFDRLDAPIGRLGGKDTPIPYNRNLERASVPQVEDIVKAARCLAREGR